MFWKCRHAETSGCSVEPGCWRNAVAPPFGRVGSRAAHWLRGVSRRLHGTYGYLACLGELGITKCDAALFITKLPKAEHDAEEWQAAMQALLLVAEHDGPTMFARIGVMQAVNRHVERVFNPSRKDKHWDAASWRGIDDGSLFLRTRT